MKAVFMIGEQRSGSNLLRCILNELAEVSAPHPPHILQRMIPLMSLYEDLNNEKVFQRLIDDVCRLVEANPIKWDKVNLDRQEIYNHCKDHSLIAVYGAIMDIYARIHGANVWVCKSMQNVRWANELNQYFDQAKYIYLYRDPRDVTLSFMKAVIGEKHPYFIAQQWTQLQELCIELYKSLGKHRVICIQYETLISQPEVELRKLCEFLKIKFSKDMLHSFCNSKEANQTAGSSQLWENLTQPIMSNNSNKFLQKLTSEQIAIIESISGKVMDYLGYQRHLIQAGQEQSYTDAQVIQFERENLKIKKMKENMSDPDDLKRREHQTTVINEIRRKAV